jgi:predicted NBD/HSP70 family sugar kinase
VNIGVPAIGIDIGGSSVKVALLIPGREPLSAMSDRYEWPSAPAIEAAIRTSIDKLGPPSNVKRAGLCVPGLRGADGLAVTESVNLPALAGLRLDALVHRAIGGSCMLRVITSDVHAAAVDIYAGDGAQGRLLVIAIGTGVGACVLDNGVQITITGQSSGHLGQMDVSLDITNEPTPIGPDGGRGSLEAYIGLPALETRYGRHIEHAVGVMNEESPPLRALARAIRISHAIYRPDRIVLAGGIGALLRPKLALLRTVIERDLTRLARPEWQLDAACGVFHAAVGVARLAGG